MDWVSVLGAISKWIILLPLTFGLPLFKSLDNDGKIILLVSFIGVIPQIMAPFFREPTLLNILYNLYTPSEFLLYWLFLFSHTKSKISRFVYYFVGLSFVAISVYLLSKNSIATQFISVWVIVNNIFQLILIGVCLLTYYYYDNLEFRLTQPFFWYLIGMILYASCTVIFYSLWNYVKESRTVVFIDLKVVHHVFNILLYLFFSWGLFMNYYREKSITHA